MTKPQASGTSGISYGVHVAISVPTPSPLQNKHFLFLKYLLYSSSFGRTQHFKTLPLLPLTKKRQRLGSIVPSRNCSSQSKSYRWTVCSACSTH
ncbi:hypothetical protein TNCT_210161 [Trichonephila clavata]|uniref:Uncharacterized protein n=1 Tax=Trichonephila clavata TaxID=2740835 RepID=A0A8X6G4E2_TRICU|nr:hypothetical protein TNCT_210161 [Trichonephila clavata]